MTTEQAVADACSNCAEPGYGAGPCAACHRTVCYGCAVTVRRDGHDGEFWFCPSCAASGAPPMPFDEDKAQQGWSGCYNCLVSRIAHKDQP